MSVRANEAGFDLRRGGPPVDLSTWRLSDGIRYDGPDGPGVAHGTRDQIASELARAGFTTITARTDNGREVRCEPGAPDKFLVQPKNDNYWVKYPSTEAALAAFGYSV